MPRCACSPNFTLAIWKVNMSITGMSSKSAGAVKSWFSCQTSCSHWYKRSGGMQEGLYCRLLSCNSGRALCSAAWCTMHTKQAACLCLFVCSGLSFTCVKCAVLCRPWLRVQFIHKYSPRETPVSQHNPVQSLKVHSGRTLAAGAVSPSPSRFQLCVHFCSPQSFWVNE